MRNNVVQFPFTQQHLADALGLSLVHTNKTIKRLMATNAIRWQGRHFELLDNSVLVGLAGSAPSTRKNRPFI